jgi:cyclohexadieny/prephenate dehydrogenase
MSSPDFQRVAILGPGLLGGSLAQALKAKRPDLGVHLWARRAQALDAPRQDKVAEVITNDLHEALEGVDLVVLCTPVTSMPDLIRTAAPHLASGTLVTDVGSVKGWLQDRIPPLLPEGVQWLGSHPMAGKETGGYGSSSPDLYEGSTTLLTPAGTSSPDAEERLAAFWQSVGCQTRSLPPRDHDLDVAHVSHVPHLLSAVLMNATPDNALKCVGPGFRDMTRVAAGPADLWESIFVTNREAIMEALKVFQSEWSQASGLITEENFDRLTLMLEEASTRRRQMSI